MKEELGKLFWNKKYVCVCVSVCVFVCVSVQWNAQRPAKDNTSSPTLGIVDVIADPGNVDIEECKTLNNQFANT